MSVRTVLRARPPDFKFAFTLRARGPPERWPAAYRRGSFGA
ncbi:MAG: hypothetical protein ACRELA_03565 [Candidatus Rokuibacteriota bacterium]